MSGGTGTQSELLYSMPASVTKNTYTTQAAFTGVAGTNSVCKLPGGWAQNENPNPVGRSLVLVAYGTIANTAAATFAVNLGMDPTAGTINQTIAVYAASAPTAATTTLWSCRVEYLITAFATSTMTLQANGYWTQSAAATGTALSASGLRMDFQGTHTGINPAVDNFIELFGTWSVSNAANTTTVQQMKLYGEN
jgi:hypothetical protein